MAPQLALDPLVARCEHTRPIRPTAWWEPGRLLDLKARPMSSVRTLLAPSGMISRFLRIKDSLRIGTPSPVLLVPAADPRSGRREDGGEEVGPCSLGSRTTSACCLAPGIATRSKDATRAPGRTTRIKKLVEERLREGRRFRLNFRAPPAPPFQPMV